MYIHELSYLRNRFGEEEAKQYITASNERAVNVVKLLKETSISQDLKIEKLKDLCHKLILGKYGQTFCKMLYLQGSFSRNNTISSIYYYVVDKYLEVGYEREEEYIQLLKDFVSINNKDSRPTVRFSMDFVENYLDIELKEVNSTKITVKEYLDNGGTVMNLLGYLALQNIKTFDLTTPFVLPDDRIVEDKQKELKRNQPDG